LVSVNRDEVNSNMFLHLQLKDAQFDSR